MAGAIAACSGAQAVPTLVSSPAGVRALSSTDRATHRRKATLAIHIRVPKAHHAKHGEHYISAATKGVSLSFTGATSLQRAIAVTPGSPQCVTRLGVTSCQISVQLPPGTYSATIAAYDEAPVAGAIPIGANVLSVARNVKITMALQVANQFGVTLDGVPASFAVDDFPSAAVGTPFASPQAFNVAVKDADGDVIVGTYNSVVSLRSSDATGATEIVTGGFDAPLAGELLSSNDTAALRYNGNAVAAQITASSAIATAGSGLFVPTGVDVVTLDTDYAPGATPGLCPAGSAGDLRAAMCAAKPSDAIFFICGNPCEVTLGAPLPPIEQNLTIDGGSYGKVIVDGDGAYRVFFVDHGNVALKNLEIQSAYAAGGNGGSATGGGGGGAGLGAGLFVNSATAVVSVTNTYFINCAVQGGVGGYSGNSPAGGGGGGLGAAGGTGASGAFGGSGGGGVVGPGAGSMSGADAGNGGLGGGGGGGGGVSPGPPFGNAGTGAAAYGGPANLPGNDGQSGSTGASGGSGGFGGGGGGGADMGIAGGQGGLGAGGGGNGGGPGGSAGPGGGGGGGIGSLSGGAGGALATISGGNGGSGASGCCGAGGGGGGAAAGPAIFVNAGVLTTFNSGATLVSASAGAGGISATSGSSGTANATPVFNYAGTVNGSGSIGPVASALTGLAPQARRHR
jgi:hypothetical protein